MAIAFWDYLIFYQMFFSPQMKRNVIVNNKHEKCNLTHELPNDCKLSIHTEWLNTQHRRLLGQAIPHIRPPKPQKPRPPLSSTKGRRLINLGK